MSYGAVLRSSSGKIIINPYGKSLYRAWSKLPVEVYETVNIETSTTTYIGIPEYSTSKGVYYSADRVRTNSAITSGFGDQFGTFTLLKWRAFIPNLFDFVPILAGVGGDFSGTAAINYIEATAGGWYVYGVSAQKVTTTTRTVHKLGYSYPFAGGQVISNWHIYSSDYTAPYISTRTGHLVRDYYLDNPSRSSSQVTYYSPDGNASVSGLFVSAYAECTPQTLSGTLGIEIKDANGAASFSYPSVVPPVFGTGDSVFAGSNGFIGSSIPITGRRALNTGEFCAVFSGASTSVRTSGTVYSSLTTTGPSAGTKTNFTMGLRITTRGMADKYGNVVNSIVDCYRDNRSETTGFRTSPPDLSFGTIYYGGSDGDTSSNVSIYGEYAVANNSSEGILYLPT